MKALQSGYAILEENPNNFTASNLTSGSSLALSSFQNVLMREDHGISPTSQFLKSCDVAICCYNSPQIILDHCYHDGCVLVTSRPPLHHPSSVRIEQKNHLFPAHTSENWEVVTCQKTYSKPSSIPKSTDLRRPENPANVNK